MNKKHKGFTTLNVLAAVGIAGVVGASGILLIKLYCQKFKLRKRPSY